MDHFLKITKKSILILTSLFIFQASAKDKLILISDPRILSVTVEDNKEPLIDLQDQTIIAWGPSPEIPNNTAYTKIRKGVYDKLVEAQKLLPPGMKFCIYEAYRTIDLQEKLFDARYQEVKKMHPSWRHPEIFKETTKCFSPVTNPDGSRNIPPHATGGAIDIYLISDTGRILDMGIHPADCMQDSDGSLSETNALQISKEARKNRDIMSKALIEVGFTNYPTEYWHWSYGDRYWAYHKGEPKAFYGPIESKG